MAWWCSLSLLSAAPIGGGGATLTGLLIIGLSTSMANWSCCCGPGNLLGRAWFGLATTCCSIGRLDRSSEINFIFFRTSVSISNGTHDVARPNKAPPRRFPGPQLQLQDQYAIKVKTPMMRRPARVTFPPPTLGSVARKLTIHHFDIVVGVVDLVIIEWELR